MAFMEKNIGFATIGANGKDGVEPASMAWVSFRHLTARPTVDIAMTDREGVEYTHTQELHDPAGTAPVAAPRADLPLSPALRILLQPHRLCADRARTRHG